MLNSVDVSAVAVRSHSLVSVGNRFRLKACWSRMLAHAMLYLILLYIIIILYIYISLSISLSLPLFDPCYLGSHFTDFPHIIKLVPLRFFIRTFLHLSRTGGSWDSLHRRLGFYIWVALVLRAAWLKDVSYCCLYARKIKVVDWGNQVDSRLMIFST